MPFPLVAVLIGAGIGAIAGGASGEDGWDWNRALLGGVLGGATGGVGAAAMGGAAAGGAALGTTGVASAAPAVASGGGWMAAGGAGTAAGFGAPAASSAAGLAPGTAAIGTGMGSTAAATTPTGIGSLSYGMGPQALANSGAQTGSLAGVTNTPLMHSYANPNAGKAFDYGQLGQSIQSFGGVAEEAEQEKPFEALPLPPENPRSRQEQTISRDLAEAQQRIFASIPGGTGAGLGGIATAAKGGIATRFGMMKTPSGSLTGGEIVGPGTGTSDTIRSGIYPDIASKLGASTSNIGQGHSVQQAALSDGEYVITAAAVQNLGKGAGAPAGQEREYGSKLLDRAMNQWQRA